MCSSSKQRPCILAFQVCVDQSLVQEDVYESALEVDVSADMAANSEATGVCRLVVHPYSGSFDV